MIRFQICIFDILNTARTFSVVRTSAMIPVPINISEMNKAFIVVYGYVKDLSDGPAALWI